MCDWDTEYKTVGKQVVQLVEELEIIHNSNSNVLFVRIMQRLRKYFVFSLNFFSDFFKCL